MRQFLLAFLVCSLFISQYGASTVKIIRSDGSSQLTEFSQIEFHDAKIFIVNSKDTAQFAVSEIDSVLFETTQPGANSTLPLFELTLKQGSVLKCQKAELKNSIWKIQEAESSEIIQIASDDVFAFKNLAHSKIITHDTSWIKFNTDLGHSASHVFITKQSVVDFIEAPIISFASDKMSLLLDGEAVELSSSRTAGFVSGKKDKISHPGLIHSKSGSLISFLELRPIDSNYVLVKLSAKLSLKFSYSEIKEISFPKKSLLTLTGAVEHKSFFDSDETRHTAVERILVQPVTKNACPDREKLSIQNSIHETGLCIIPETTVRYKLALKYKSVQFTLGINDSVIDRSESVPKSEASATVIVRIEYATGEAAPKPNLERKYNLQIKEDGIVPLHRLSFDLENARQLEITVTYLNEDKEHDTSVQDFIVIGSPTLSE